MKAYIRIDVFKLEKVEQLAFHQKFVHTKVSIEGGETNEETISHGTEQGSLIHQRHSQRPFCFHNRCHRPSLIVKKQINDTE
jgi:hypothetical protein